jgi:hypothetical protein
MPSATEPTLTSDRFADLVEHAKEGNLPDAHLRYVFGFVQTREPRRVAREGMALHPILMEADINGATVVAVRRTPSGFEQAFKGPRLDWARESCPASPEMMVAQLRLKAEKWSDEHEQFLLALAQDTSVEDFSSVVVVRTRTRLATWWVTYEQAQGLSGMLVPPRESVPLP